MSDRFTIAIPMAGYGTRLRPHTWSKPKPLIHLAGKTVLDYVLAQFDTLPGVADARWVLIVGPNQLEQVREYMQAHYPDHDVRYVVQEVMRGQSDALYLAREHLDGPMLMTFSDTLIETDLTFLKDTQLDGIAWVKQVEDPRRFGAARVNEEGLITSLIEKPQDVRDNLVLVGFYYFKSGCALMHAIEEQKKQDLQLKGEYYLADAVNVLLEEGSRFVPHPVNIWLDAGTRESLLQTNVYLLDHGHDNSADAARLPGVRIIPPVNISLDARLSHAVIGPHVSLGSNVELDHVTLSDCIIEDGTKITNSKIHHSHIGKDCRLEGVEGKLNIGDTSWVELT